MTKMYMETTEIPPEQTIGEIQRVLARYGAEQVLTEFADGEVVGVFFKISYAGKAIPFKLPCRFEPLLKILNGRRRSSLQEKHLVDDQAQAKRVAWRQIYRWVEAQLALVDTQMVTVVEVFTPYIQMKNGETLYQQLAARKFTALTDQRA